MTPDEEALSARSDQWDEAVQARDLDAVVGLIDEEFALVLVQPAAATVAREQWVAMLPDYVVHRWEQQEQVVHVTGDLGAILQRVHMTATVLGQDRSGIFFLTDIWRRVGGDWRVWRRHSSPLTAGAMP